MFMNIYMFKILLKSETENPELFTVQFCIQAGTVQQIP